MNLWERLVVFDSWITNRIVQWCANRVVEYTAISVRSQTEFMCWFTSLAAMASAGYFWFLRSDSASAAIGVVMAFATQLAYYSSRMSRQDDTAGAMPVYATIMLLLRQMLLSMTFVAIGTVFDGIFLRQKDWGPLVTFIAPVCMLVYLYLNECNKNPPPEDVYRRLRINNI